MTSANITAMIIASVDSIFASIKAYTGTNSLKFDIGDITASDIESILDEICVQGQKHSLPIKGIRLCMFPFGEIFQGKPPTFQLTSNCFVHSHSNLNLKVVCWTQDTDLLEIVFK